MSLLRVNIIKPFYALKSVNAGSNPVLFGRIKSRIRIRNADFSDCHDLKMSLPAASVLGLFSQVKSGRSLSPPPIMLPICHALAA